MVLFAGVRALSVQGGRARRGREAVRGERGRGDGGMTATRGSTSFFALRRVGSVGEIGTSRKRENEVKCEKVVDSGLYSSHVTYIQAPGDSSTYGNSRRS